MATTSAAAASSHGVAHRRRRKPVPAARTLPVEAKPPAAPIKSPEYAPVDLRDVTGGILGGTATEFAAPYLGAAVARVLDPKRFPYLGTRYGSVIPGKVTGTVIGQFNGLVSSVVADALKGSKGEPGLGWKPAPPNKLLASTAKGVITTWAKMALADSLRPAPEPKPIYPADVQPIGVDAPPPKPVPRKVLLTDTAQIKDTITAGLVGMGISTLYDQTVGPLVQRVANIVTGHGGDEVKAPAPITPGSVVSGLADAVLSSMLVRQVSYQPLPPAPGDPVPQPGPTPLAGALGASIINGVLGAAWSTVYGRGLGPAIENGVNQLAGIRSKEEQEQAQLPALEHFLRAAPRGVAVGATTYALGNALQGAMLSLGTHLGGVGGALVAVAGAALIGSVGGSIIDATIGPTLGKLGGQIYSLITGKPSYEQRMRDDASKAPTPENPGPTPGDPVKSPNGNPGTVPAPAAPKAPAAPAAGRPRKRRPTGNRAVDATAPARSVPPARLAAIAASHI